MYDVDTPAWVLKRYCELWPNRKEHITGTEMFKSPDPFEMAITFDDSTPIIYMALNDLVFDASYLQEWERITLPEAVWLEETRRRLQIVTRYTTYSIGYLADKTGIPYSTLAAKINGSRPCAFDQVDICRIVAAREKDDMFERIFGPYDWLHMRDIEAYNLANRCD